MQLEILAPAGNKDIGIAAIDCGADAVYIAGPRFGARQAAGNPVEEIGLLARYAHRYNARVYAVVNTILFDDELDAARAQMWELAEAGVDAFIIQDLGLLRLDLPPLPLFASTQTVIRTPEEARMMESLGFRRLILERQISLEEIRAIRAAVRCELEFFVHGALCVSYSGQCYLSQALTGRSANRGACIQACRSLYNLVDADGRVLLHDRSLLSLKDFRLDERLGDLIGAGISSFKIEGRLKNASYVKNVVRHYRAQLDAWMAAHPGYTHASAGTPVGGFTPELDATFNRGYTTAFLDGRGGAWNSVDAAKSLGAYLGTIRAVEGDWIVIDTQRKLAAGDGLAFVSRSGELSGMRVESVAGAAAESGSGATAGQRVRLKTTAGRYRGEKVYRNLDVAFERELERNMPRRLIDAVIDYRTAAGETVFTARLADSEAASGTCEARIFLSERSKSPEAAGEVARNPETALESLRNQLSKITEPYRFTLGTVEADTVYFYPAAFLNGIRRDLAAKLTAEREAQAASGACSARIFSSEQSKTPETAGAGVDKLAAASAKVLDYRANCANRKAREVLTELGAASVAPAYELEAPRGAEVMRSRYCIKYELGLCPKHLLKTSQGQIPGNRTEDSNGQRSGQPAGQTPKIFSARDLREPLYLENNGRRLQLKFDCKNCEMVVIL